MTLIGRCEQHLKDVSSFFQPPHSVEGLKDKTFEKLYYWFATILKINETYIHLHYQNEEF